MKLLKIVLPNMEEKIVFDYEVDDGADGPVYWQRSVESLGYTDDNEEEFEESVWDTDVQIIDTYYAHLNVSKLSWTSMGEDMYAYSLVILDRNGDVVGMMADTESGPCYYDEDRVAGDIDVIRIATDLIKKESL